MPIYSIDVTARIQGTITVQDNDITAPQRPQDMGKTGIDLSDMLDTWGARTAAARRLAAEMIGIDERRGIRMATCGDWMDLATCPMGDHAHVARAAYCGDRLCPTCSAARARALADEMCAEIAEMLRRDPRQRFALLTLTTPNVPGAVLGAEIGMLLAAWRDMSRTAAIKRATVGWIRKLELTLCDVPRRKAYGTHHVHLHIMLAMHPDYGRDADRWLSQRDYQRLWAQALHVDLARNHLIVDIRAADENGAKEVAKYVSKPAAYVGHADDTGPQKRMRRRALEDVARALRGVRAVSWGGLWRIVRRDLGHTRREEDVPRDSDVTQCPVCSTELERTIYHWAGADYVGGKGIFV